MYESIKLTIFLFLIFLFLGCSILNIQAGGINKKNKKTNALNNKSEIAIIVDPFSSGALIAGELKKYNIQSIAVFSKKEQPSYMISSYRKDDFLDKIIFYGDIDRIVKLISSKYKVSAVIAGTESGVLLTDKLAYKFNTISNDINKSLARRNKLEMQNIIASKNLLHIPSIATNDFSDIIEWSSKQQTNKLCSNGYIIKPIQSAGTDGVKYGKNLREIETAFNSLLKTKDLFGNINDKVLAQCFMKGEEYVVDTISIDGKHIVTGVLKYNKTKTKSGNLIYNYMDFLSQDTSPEKDIILYAKDVITALGVQNGSSHTEIMYTEVGPVLIESGARMHGGANPLYSKACSGNSQLEMIPKVYFNEIKKRYYNDVINYSYNLIQNMRVVFLISPDDIKFQGAERATKFITKITGLKTYYDSHLNLKKPEITKTVDLMTAPGFIVLMGNKSDIEHDTMSIRNFEKNLYNK